MSRTRRWVLVACAALTAGFVALVSAVAPGHSLASKSQLRPSTESATAGSSALPAMPPPANPSDLGLQGPDQAPSPAPQQPQPQSIPSQPPADSSPAAGGGPVVSGGS